MGLPGPLVSGSPGGTSGPLGGISPASGSNLVVGASGTNQRRFDEDVNLPLIKVVVLGAPAVGKTSVVRVSSPFLYCTKLRSVKNLSGVRKNQFSFE